MSSVSGDFHLAKRPVRWIDGQGGNRPSVRLGHGQAIRSRQSMTRTPSDPNWAAKTAFALSAQGAPRRKTPRIERVIFRLNPRCSNKQRLAGFITRTSLFVPTLLKVTYAGRRGAFDRCSRTPGRRPSRPEQAVGGCRRQLLTMGTVTLAVRRFRQAKHDSRHGLSAAALPLWAVFYPGQLPARYS